MIVMIIIIFVSPHSLSGSFVALSSSSTGTQARAIPLTAQTWNPPYTFMLTVCQRLRGKCTKVIRYWGYRIHGEIEVNFRAGWWLLYGISLEWVGGVKRWQGSLAFVIQFASVLRYNVWHRFLEHITLSVHMECVIYNISRALLDVLLLLIFLETLMFVGARRYLYILKFI